MITFLLILFIYIVQMFCKDAFRQKLESNSLKMNCNNLYLLRDIPDLVANCLLIDNKTKSVYEYHDYFYSDFNLTMYYINLKTHVQYSRAQLIPDEIGKVECVLELYDNEKKITYKFNSSIVVDYILLDEDFCFIPLHSNETNVVSRTVNYFKVDIKLRIIFNNSADFRINNKRFYSSKYNMFISYYTEDKITLNVVLKIYYQTFMNFYIKVLYNESFFILREPLNFCYYHPTYDVIMVPINIYIICPSGVKFQVTLLQGICMVHKYDFYNIFECNKFINNSIVVKYLVDQQNNIITYHSLALSSYIYFYPLSPKRNELISCEVNLDTAKFVYNWECFLPNLYKGDSAKQFYTTYGKTLKFNDLAPDIIFICRCDIRAYDNSNEVLFLTNMNFPIRLEYDAVQYCEVKSQVVRMERSPVIYFVVQFFIFIFLIILFPFIALQCTNNIVFQLKRKTYLFNNMNVRNYITREHRDYKPLYIHGTFIRTRELKLLYKLASLTATRGNILQKVFEEMIIIENSIPVVFPINKSTRNAELRSHTFLPEFAKSQIINRVNEYYQLLKDQVVVFPSRKKSIAANLSEEYKLSSANTENMDENITEDEEIEIPLKRSKDEEIEIPFKRSKDEEIEIPFKRSKPVNKMSKETKKEIFKKALRVLTNSKSMESQEYADAVKYLKTTKPSDSQEYMQALQTLERTKSPDSPDIRRTINTLKRFADRTMQIKQPSIKKIKATIIRPKTTTMLHNVPPLKQRPSSASTLVHTTPPIKNMQSSAIEMKIYKNYEKKNLFKKLSSAPQMSPFDYLPGK